MQNEKVKITLLRSPIGTHSSHRATVIGLGLKRIRQSRILVNTPEVRGMIRKISYLLDVENV